MYTLSYWASISYANCSGKVINLCARKRRRYLRDGRLFHAFAYQRHTILWNSIYVYNIKGIVSLMTLAI